jgi:integrase
MGPSTGSISVARYRPRGRPRAARRTSAGDRAGRIETLLRRALARAKLPAIRVHDLRHVFASHFVMGGGDIFTLQRILGHSTPQLTSDTYAHLSPRHLAGEADRVAYPEPAGPAKVLSLAADAGR